MAGNFPTLKFGSHYYEIGQIIDKSLYARKPVVRQDYVYPGPLTNVTIPKGGYVGKIYSWVESGGKLYLTLYGKYPYTNSVLYDPLAFSESALEAQGSLTVEEEAAAKKAAEEQAGKSTIDKIIESLGLSSIGTVVKIGVPLFAFGFIGFRLLAEKNKADRYKLQKNNSDE